MHRCAIYEAGPMREVNRLNRWGRFWERAGAVRETVDGELS